MPKESQIIPNNVQKDYTRIMNALKNFQKFYNSLYEQYLDDYSESEKILLKKFVNITNKELKNEN